MTRHGFYARGSLIIGYQSFGEDEDPIEALEFAACHGLGLVEFNANMPWFFPERFDDAARALLRDTAQQKGVRLAIHAPEELSLVSPHDTLLSAAIERFEAFIRLASDVGAEILTCHIGGNYLRWATGDARVLYPHDLYPTHMRRSFTRSLPGLAERCKEAGVKLSLENAGYFGPALVQDMVHEVLQSSPLYLTWDVGHSNTRDGRLERHERFILSHIERVALLHLHDNDGIVDSHSPLGAGTVDISKALRVAGQTRAPISIEVRPRSFVPQCLRAIALATGLG